MHIIKELDEKPTRTLHTSTKSDHIQVFVTGPFAAMFYQRFGPKAGIISGGLISAAGFALNSVAASIQWMYTFAIVIGKIFAFSSREIFAHYIGNSL